MNKAAVATFLFVLCPMILPMTAGSHGRAEESIPWLSISYSFISIQGINGILNGVIFLTGKHSDIRDALVAMVKCKQYNLP